MVAKVDVKKSGRPKKKKSERPMRAEAELATKDKVVTNEVAW